MAALDFNGGVVVPADYTPGYILPTGFDAGEQTTSGTFKGVSIDTNSGWISSSLTGGNHYSEIVWPGTGNSTQSRGPIFVNSAGDGYLLLVRGTDVRFFVIQSGALLQVGSGITQTTTAGDLVRLSYLGSGAFTFNHNGVEIGSATDTTVAAGLSPGFVSRGFAADIDSFSADALALPSIRKGGAATFDKPAGIGNITGVTLNGNAITLDTQDASTFTVTDSDGSIATSGAYDLVATGDTVETISVQVNVYGVVPSDNPWQKEGVALASLTNVQYRLVAGSALNGTQLQYTGTGTTDASGNIPTFDVSDTAAVVDDAVHIVGLTATGESIVAPETVELI